MQNTNFTDQFLIAMPALTDPYFARSLVFVCEHNERGALGVIVNRPLDMTLGSLFERVELKLDDHALAGQPVYFGGPVQTDRGFVLHRNASPRQVRSPESGSAGSSDDTPASAWQSSLRVNDWVSLTSSRDILASISAKGLPRELIVTLGYAGWSAGQLENEMLQNAWLNVPGDSRILFDMPYEERLPAAMQSLGVDFSTLSDVAGHA
jgi:putative transcriptional regulator